jgi:hypothetical protein
MPVSSALGSAALAPSGFGFRNLLINGAMQVHQRGTSTASITTSGYFTADRWQHGVETMGTWTSSVENDAPTGSGFRKSLKVLCTTADVSPAAGDNVAIQQQFEGQNLQMLRKGTSSAQQVTVSFWVKSNVTGTYICELFDFDNTRQASRSYTVSASATWEKKTITFPADTSGALDNDNASSLMVKFWLGAGSTFTSGTLNTLWASNTSANRAVGQVNLAATTNNYWQVTGVQLEANSVATDFEHRPIGVELALCQRYYEKSYNLTTNPGTATSVGVVTSSQNAAAVTTGYIGSAASFKTTKRTTPSSIRCYDPAGNIDKCQRWTLGVVNSNNHPIAVEGQGEYGFLTYSSGTQNAAAIQFHYTADAEL